ncbi:hypothetical protein CLHUN_39070 [Ruminiclostridium hungatei]|uniref:Uncharacterized protein n=1 Tax=Ruminiclostridium hungatei TaxID=48256 RepID=A0A1V4SFG9_RUMHU|nr:helix-turn-helix domain-containing protein [Ruminiclostridium hungatei]OPX42256.1 hypothetical protein CLHUN_39070 [Ruminiclostridium hungatei]
MKKTVEQLQAALDREMEYTKKLNKKIDLMRKQLKDRITIQEHEKVLALLQEKHAQEIAKINNRQSQKYNERGAGRKKKATNQVILRVLELRQEGLSQQKISKAIFEELGLVISRTTVGEIVRGEHGNGAE